MTEVQASTLLRRSKVVVAALLAMLLASGALVLVLRTFQARALANAAEIHAVQYVTVTRAVSGAAGAPVKLPGSLQGVIETTVYARSSGYVLRYTKDIGAVVKKGDLLAEIAAPEIDQQLAQAQAARVQSAASESLSKTSADRWQNLRAKDAVTQQELDERLGAYQQARADLAAATANVSRLRSLQGFSRVTAPIDGVVTRRNVDVGDLVNAGNGGAASALFTVAQTDLLRLYIYVPQAYADRVKVGDNVAVSLAERAGTRYQGSIARTARAIDPTTRTLQAEIRVPNPDGALLAGSYVEVSLDILGESAALVIPTNVLLFRAEGPRVAVVDGGGHVHLTAVEIGTDFGTSLQVLHGIGAADQIIVNPADSIADGDAVTLVDVAGAKSP